MLIKKTFSRGAGAAQRSTIRFGVAVLSLSELVSLDELGDLLVRESVLAFPFHKVLGSVDEMHVVELIAFLE